MATGTLHHDLGGIDIAKPSPPKLARFAWPKAFAGHGRAPLALLAEFARLHFGEGRLSLNEYIQLQLYDDARYAGTDKRAFVGMKATPKIWLNANYRVDLVALTNNKIASDIWFATHGLPVLPTIALFHDGVGRPGPFLLRDAGELRAFLRNSEHYPLFGKPVGGFQSIGSVSLERYDAASDHVVNTTGHWMRMDDLAAYVKAHGAAGYQFQQRVSPHAAVRALCGERLATVRLLTIVQDGRPEILRACWKIPAGPHAADNFWRPGNLLAQLDLETGRVLRVIRGSGTAYEEVQHHPDSGVRITDTLVPNWDAVRALALDAARLLEDLPLVGWDIAPTDDGAVLVEPNVTPDFRLHQMADRRGLLDPAFRRFIARRKRDAAEALRAARRGPSAKPKPRDGQAPAL